MENLASVMLLSPSATILIQITLTENFLSAKAIQLICHYITCFFSLLAARDMIGQCDYTTAMAPEHGTTLPLACFILTVFTYALQVPTRNFQFSSIAEGLHNNTLSKRGQSLKTPN